MSDIPVLSLYSDEILSARRAHRGGEGLNQQNDTAERHIPIGVRTSRLDVLMR